MNPDVVSAEKTCWFIFQKKEWVLLNKDKNFPNEIEILKIKSCFIRFYSLGHMDGIDYFCAELDEFVPFLDDFHAVSFKQALSMIYPMQYSMGVRAHAILNWDHNHQFCGRCATPTLHHAPHFERRCPACQLVFFPRISPAVIVLIYRGEELVMAKAPHYAPGVYGLIAGFVESGESLEDTVHREIKEEVGLHVKNITYFGSQPWPFPDSLMLGFTAEYDFGELVIDRNEIEHAGWYRYDALPGGPSSSMSIASALLDHFIHRCQNTASHEIMDSN